MQPKTLSLPLLGSILSITALPVSGQVQMIIEANRTYRQLGGSVDALKFRGGELKMNLTDGSWSYTCDYPTYEPPTLGCPIGSTGYLIQGNPEPGGTETGPYYSITSLQEAVAVEPRREDRCLLVAAPASTLARPSGLFKDRSYSFYWNILTTDIAEYTLSDYIFSRRYGGGQLAKMRSDIVPGVYKFTFPRITRPDLSVSISSVVYPMPNGYEKVQNKIQGFRFTGLKSFTKQGFLELDPNFANVISWDGLNSGNVYGSADSLFFVLRNIKDDSGEGHQSGDAKDNVAARNMFPDFVNTSGEDRVRLSNVFVKKFVLPPGLHDTFRSGHKGIAEVILERSITTNGVSYDESSRVFQLPISFKDHYKNFAKVWFGKSKAKTGLKDDYDGDGALNFEEWALRSNPANRFSEPVEPVAQRETDITFLEELSDIFFYEVLDYYGFRYSKRHSLVPGITFLYEYRDTPTGVAPGPWLSILDPEFQTGSDWNVVNSDDYLFVYYPVDFLDDDGNPEEPREFRVRAVLK